MPTHETGIKRIAFGLFLLLIFSLGFMKPSIEFAILTPTDVIFPLVFGCWLAAIAFGACRFKWRTEFVTFGFYFLALIVSSIFSTNPRLSFVKVAGAAYLILLAIMAASIVTTRDQLRLSIVAWVAGSLIPITAAFVGIILFYFVPESPLLSDLTYHYGAVPVGNFPRIRSTFVSASMLCNYLTVTLILTLLCARMKWIGNGLAGAIVFAIGVSAIFTVSIALGGIALAIGLWLWITCSNKTVGRSALIFSGAVAVAFLAMAPFALSLQPGASFFERLAPSSRFLVWSDALNTFLSDPLTGNGVGTAVANVVFQNYDGSRSLLTDAHNTFLNVAAQAGIFGLVAIIGIALVTLKAGEAKSACTDRDYIPHALAIAFIVGFIYDGLTGSFEDARHLWILIGLILATSRITAESDGSASLNSA